MRFLIHLTGHFALNSERIKMLSSNSERKEKHHKERNIELINVKTTRSDKNQPQSADKMSRVVRKPAFCICEKQRTAKLISAFVFAT